MARRSFTFTAELWEHDGPGAWHFLSVPEAVADEIEEACRTSASAFGSVRVAVTVGSTTWATSLFPDRKRATYLLPVKRTVREAEGLAPGSVVAVELAVVDT